MSLRNPLLPVNRLPPEVLTSCATFVSNTDPRPTISLTHVCRYWRGSISSNPRSWALIASGWKQLAPLCLRRAGAVPLVADITVPDLRGNSRFLRALLPCVSRIARLSLTGTYLSRLWQKISPVSLPFQCSILPPWGSSRSQNPPNYSHLAKHPCPRFFITFQGSSHFT